MPVHLTAHHLQYPYHYTTGRSVHHHHHSSEVWILMKTLLFSQVCDKAFDYLVVSGVVFVLLVVPQYL